jgi:heptosyltransferase-2
MKILIVAPSWIGDTVLMQPLLSRLHEQRAGLRIDVLASAWSAPLIARMPEVTTVIDSPFRHGEFNFGARRQLGRRLAAAGYDEAIVLPNSWKSALVPFFAGIPVRTGYHGEARYVLLNRRHRLDRARHPRLADRYAQLAESPGTLAAVTLRPPHLVADPERQYMTRTALGLPVAGEPVVFCPGAEFGPAKRWPAAHFAALARTLGSREQPVWLVGSAKDAPVGEEIVALAEGAALNLCGRTSLDQAIDLIAGARQMVCNDSGLMHIAAALDRPLVAVFGSSSPDYTPPMSSRARIVSLALDCSPCFKRECPLGHLRCLNDLTPERVSAARETR